MVEHANGIDDARDIEKEDDARGRKHPQALDAERLIGLVILQGVQRHTGFFLQVLEEPTRVYPESGRLGNAAQPRACDLTELAFEDGEPDLNVEIGAKAIQLLGATCFRRRIGRRVRRRQRGRRLRNQTNKRVDIRARR